MKDRKPAAAPVEVETPAAASEAPTKVVQMETGAKTVSFMLRRANEVAKKAKSLELLYALREKFNTLFANPESGQPSEISAVYLVTPSASRYNDDGSFKVTNPETIQKIRELVSLDLADRIEAMEQEILTYQL